MNSGPLAKDPTSRRRRNAATANLLELPRDGYQGPIPEWPVATPPSTEVFAAWQSLWRRPQAAAWAGQGFETAIARLAALIVASMDPESPAAVLTEVRQMEDRLGLNPPAMARLRWKLEDLQEEDAEVVPIAPKTRRVKAVE